MAGPSQSQALYEMSQILHGDREAREQFDWHSTMITMHFWDPTITWRFNEVKNITRVRLEGERYLRGNLKLAMIKEFVGIAPERYCIMFYDDPRFYSKLKLLMSCLPEEKMFLYPATAVLGGSFLQEPWLSRGRALRSRPSLTFEEYMEIFTR